MQKKPKISIVIPAYNRALTITRTLDSVLAQSYSNWESLVVDDCSTDETRNVVMKYCEKDSRIMYFTNERRKGACGARNTGILHARGEFVSLMDSDDEYLPQALEKQVNLLSHNPEIGCAYSRLYIENVDGEQIEFGGEFGLQGNVYAEVLKQGYVAPTSVLFARRDILLASGLFDEALPASQDDDIFFKLTKISKLGFIDKHLVVFHTDAYNRISNKRNPAFGWWMLWNKYEEDVVRLCGYETMAKHYRMCMHFFVYADEIGYVLRAMKKYYHFGGRLYKKRIFWLTWYLLTFGHYTKAKDKLLLLI